MPVFGVLAFKGLVLNLFLELVEEPVLGAHAEVTHGQKTELL